MRPEGGEKAIPIFLDLFPRLIEASEEFGYPSARGSAWRKPGEYYHKYRDYPTHTKEVEPDVRIVAYLRPLPLPFSDVDVEADDEEKRKKQIENEMGA
jgi:hypothetical protein